MKSIRSFALAIAALLVMLPSAAGAAQEPRDRGFLKEVGHEPLMKRGMNSALAIHGRYAYVGSRTDAHPNTPHGGLMVVDIARPSRPRLVSSTIDARPGESTRELRVWKSQNVLIVLNTNCGVGPNLHHCTAPSVSNVRFYDISGANARSPRVLTELKVDTHEFYLWQDPKQPRRALMFAGNAGSRCVTRGGAPSCPLAVWDISRVRSGGAPVTLYSGAHGYEDVGAPDDPRHLPSGGLHSLSVSNDGRRAYYALLEGGFAVVDVSEFARGAASPQPRPITGNTSRPTWAGPGAHSAVKLWNRDWVWVTDEVYGSATAPGHGCPWGWSRTIDISNERQPTVKAEYRLPQNLASPCSRWEPRPRTSYSAHNPTLTPRIAFTTWHSGGVQAVSLESPRSPYRLAQFMPKPLDNVMLEDPRLSSDPDTGNHEKVVMWSYPIIADGLVYVVDVRNGLYVLRYGGRFKREVERIGFLEGNSNQGDALCYEPVGRAPRHCRD